MKEGASGIRHKSITKPSKIESALHQITLQIPDAFWLEIEVKIERDIDLPWYSLSDLYYSFTGKWIIYAMSFSALFPHLSVLGKDGK